MPAPVLVAFGLLVLLLSTAAVVGDPSGTPPDAEAETRAPTVREAVVSRAAAPPPPPPAAPPGSTWSGHAFDACRAPSQRVMDRWRTTSPFSGIGIYLGGIHRACEQRHLDARWVARQRRAGWQLLPIWVGPQASCTGYDHRIASKPGPRKRYLAARVGGVRQARQAAAAARNLRLPRGSLVFYDIEPFDTGVTRCRESSLAFLEEWTQELHRQGYRSGVYSHVNAGISLLSRTGRGYTRPDAVWYAWIDRPGSLPREHVADAGFHRDSRVHQYALDTRVEFGGIGMDIDWNFVALGTTSRPHRPVGCDQRADRARPDAVRPGHRGAAVRTVQCLLPGDVHPTKATGRYDARTTRAVRAFQQRRGLPVTGAVDRRTWVALLSRGATPELERGARGDHVRRLQRSLAVALGDPGVRVDGSFGRETARAVKRYRVRLGIGDRGVVTDRVWNALARGGRCRSGGE
ncbi:glycoside hydrolase domain-containing protein [Nocardioides sp. TF02-7]|uniref:glycoside hydrolase domain-containing protein n=1 Tax=Nocardioides sp. TF02-7 TaxID=2917724 RepID=UPI001F051A83|nr:glycoside hydrolase domain-containing protein [Nocardioides sp. TF02-7]UMG92534.1 DUF1906 domain-containing protein [Nocardioides sp. TF02-7]